MPIPILAALALQAAGAGLSAYSANRANKKNREAMDAAARRVGQFQVNPLGNKLAQAYSESKLAENDLNQYQKQEAQESLGSTRESLSLYGSYNRHRARQDATYCTSDSRWYVE